MEQRPSTLMARLDALEADHGHAIAQSYIASGNPDDAPHELTFSGVPFGEVRRRSNALTALGVGSSDIIGFARAAVGNILSDHGRGDGHCHLRPGQLFPRTGGAYSHREGERCHCVPDPPALRQRPELVGKLRRVYASLPHVRSMRFGSGPAIEGADDLEATAAVQSSSSWKASTRGRTGKRQ